MIANFDVTKLFKRSAVYLSFNHSAQMRGMSGYNEILCYSLGLYYKEVLLFEKKN